MQPVPVPGCRAAHASAWRGHPADDAGLRRCCRAPPAAAPDGVRGSAPHEDEADGDLVQRARADVGNVPEVAPHAVLRRGGNMAMTQLPCRCTPRASHLERVLPEPVGPAANRAEQVACEHHMHDSGALQLAWQRVGTEGAGRSYDGGASMRAGRQGYGQGKQARSTLRMVLTPNQKGVLVARRARSSFRMAALTWRPRQCPHPLSTPMPNILMPCMLQIEAALQSSYLVLLLRASAPLPGPLRRA